MKNSGVSLITLIVIIVILIILANIAIIGGIESVKESNAVKIQVEISEIKKAVSDRILEVEKNPSLGYPGAKINDPTEYFYFIDNMTNDELNDALLSINDETLQYFRLVNSTDAIQLGVTAVDEEHYFIVDYYNGKVYGSVNMDKYLGATGG